MQIHISGREVKPSTRLRVHIQRRLNFALQRFAPHIRKLHVQVRDLNGPRGGVDKSCQLKIFLISGATRVLEERAPNAYLAIDSLADKAATSIARRLQRKHDHRRGHSLSRLASGGKRVSVAALGKSKELCEPTARKTSDRRLSRGHSHRFTEGGTCIERFFAPLLTST